MDWKLATSRLITPLPSNGSQCDRITIPLRMLREITAKVAKCFRGNDMALIDEALACQIDIDETGVTVIYVFVWSETLNEPVCIFHGDTRYLRKDFSVIDLMGLHHA